ncbi:hypothetical protein NL676_036908 [Syzygium grande]|nr:hypothetical protein NL676_036908 [Syzygium grande]
METASEHGTERPSRATGFIYGERRPVSRVVSGLVAKATLRPPALTACQLVAQIRLIPLNQLCPISTRPGINRSQRAAGAASTAARLRSRSSPDEMHCSS